jgi:collagenase-like PrtC family protease
MSTSPQLTLGPVLYLWDAEAWRDFYFRIADEAPVEVVSIGEVVCSKRQHFHVAHLDEVVARLQAAGKTVRLATLALVTLEREQRSVRALAQQPECELEVNDLSALPALAGRRHAIGPLVNVYNGATARFLAAHGAGSICMPPELPLASVRAITAAAPEIAWEVFAFGRVPLAISARCAHARVKGFTKDNCQFICAEDPDGLAVETLDRQPFLALNGVQTVSFTCQTSITDLATLQAAGVSRFRLSPQRCDMVAVARIYRDVLDGRLEPEAGLAGIRALYPELPMANGFLHGVPGAELILTQPL